MKIDKQLFPMNALDLEGKKVLFRPEAAESTNKIMLLWVNPRTIKIAIETWKGLSCLVYNTMGRRH